MNRIGAFGVLLICVCSDALAQTPGGATPSQGLKIVSRSELRAWPGVPPEEAARLLALREQNVPPDGVARSTLYVKGSAIRIEHAADPGGRVSISPAGESTVYVVNERTKTYWTYSLSGRGSLARWMNVKSAPTGRLDTIASFPAEEVRFSARYLRPTPVRDIRPPSASRDDGLTDPASSSTPPRGATTELSEADYGIDGQAWFVTLPGGADTRKLMNVIAGNLELVPASQGRYPARLVTRFVGLRSTPKTELHDTVETVEVLPLDDHLFQLPEGLRKVKMPAAGGGGFR